MRKLHLLFRFSSKIKHQDMNNAFKEFKKEKKFEFTGANNQINLEQNQKFFNDYHQKIKFEESLDEEKLMEFIGRSYFLPQNQENKEKIQFIIQNRIQLFNQVKDYKVAVSFLHFCSQQKYDDVEIWQYLSSYFLNHQYSLNFQDKMTILNCYRQDLMHNQQEFKQFFQLFENDMLKQARDDFNSIYLILKLYRENNEGNQAFFFTLEQEILDKFQDAQISPLINLVLYYSNTQYELTDTKIKMLQTFEEKFKKVAKFLQPREIITVFFCYIKSGIGSKILFQLLDERCLDIIEEFTMPELQKILLVYSNMPQQQKKIFFNKAEEYILDNLKLIKRGFIPDLFFSFCENGLGSDKFYEQIQDIIINIIFQLNTQQIVNCIWGFSIQNIKNQQLFFKKIIEVFKDTNQLYQFDIKQISTIVWCLSKTNNYDQQVFDELEKIIQNQIDKLTIKEISQILWSYTLNKPLKMNTIVQISDQIEKNIEDADTWDLQMISWSYSKFKETDERIFELLGKQILDQIEEFDKNELVQIIRAFVEINSQNYQLYDSIQIQIYKNIDDLVYQDIISLLYSFSNIKDQKNYQQIIIDLYNLLQKNKELQVQEDSDLDYYLNKLEVEKYK